MNSSPFRVFVGVTLAVAASLGLAWLFVGTKSSTAVPLWFIVVLYVLARRYGIATGIIGSLLCAFVFAHFLFDPAGSWHVEDMAARRNLVWMIAGATTVSYLLTPSSSRRRRS